MILPCPTCPLATQARFGQNTCEASICSVVVFIFTDYRWMLFIPSFGTSVHQLMESYRSSFTHKSAWEGILQLNVPFGSNAPHIPNKTDHCIRCELHQIR